MEKYQWKKRRKAQWEEDEEEEAARREGKAVLVRMMRARGRTCPASRAMWNQLRFVVLGPAPPHRKQRGWSLPPGGFQAGR